MSKYGEDVVARANELFGRAYHVVTARMDRLMMWLMVVQWVAGILTAHLFSPRVWQGRTHVLHHHIETAVFLGAAISIIPIVFALRYPGRRMTRLVMATAQMFWSLLLIHLTGGRIETHFHIFGSLALIAFYRDPMLLAPATALVVGDHVFRGIFWPESMYGTTHVGWWHFLEHSAWLLFSDVFLFINCRNAYRELKSLSLRQAHIERSKQSLRRWAESLESKVSERTRELSEANERLSTSLGDLHHAQRENSELARSAGRAEVATEVLHNVGNVLNSVEVATAQIDAIHRNSPVAGLGKLADRLLSQEDVGAFLTRDPLGVRIPTTLRRLASALEAEHDTAIRETDVLRERLAHVAHVISQQQTKAKQCTVEEDLSLSDLVSTVMLMTDGKARESNVHLEHDAVGDARVVADRHHLLQIVTNLVRNAVQAAGESDVADRRVMVTARTMDERARIEVSDNGVGIDADTMARVFEYGFSTKETGHGFGLHWCANAAKTIGGRLWGESDGVGKGARFVLEFPMGATSDATATRDAA